MYFTVYRSIVRWKNGNTVYSRWWDGRFMYCIQQIVKWKMLVRWKIHILTTGGGEVEECIYCLQVGGDGKNECTEYRRW
jgi:hypothetical protein